MFTTIQQLRQTQTNHNDKKQKRKQQLQQANEQRAPNKTNKQ